MFSSTEVTRSIMNRSSWMIQSYHILKDQSHRIHSEPKFIDDTILLRSRVLESSDPFWAEVHGWYNPTTFTGTEASGYILNKSSGMMQSHHIHGDRSLQIHFEQKFKDDTIPLHSRRPKSLDHFRTSVQGWYNPNTFSRTKVTGSVLDKCPRMIQYLFIL